MSSITTASGKHVDPLRPAPKDLDLSDIAHALSLLCRGNGHVSHLYTVGQHSIACCREAAARGASPFVQAACLLHDAAEAYLCDLPRPIKKELPAYQEAEDRLLGMIFRRFLLRDLTKEERAEVAAVDDDMLSYEFRSLFPEPLGENWKHIQSAPDLSFQDPKVTEEAFLSLARALFSEIGGPFS
ncbi:MAG: hypothetical protein ACI4OJ_12560 [Lachnospiraceae bacterium]